MEKIAIVIFVKTPDVSPCKTRLAADIGTEKSLDFYKHSVQVTQSVIQELNHDNLYIDPYFAVAEQEGMASKYWSAFHRIYQGSGDLGDRLAHVYEELITKYNGVIFLGSDCPHIKKDVLDNCLDHFATGQKEFILGKCADGGFYLFGGSCRLFSGIWTTVSYSEPTTANQLLNSLSKIGPVKLIEESFDIDNYQDLENYHHIDKKKLSENQREFIVWVQESFLDKDKK